MPGGGAPIPPSILLSATIPLTSPERGIGYGGIMRKLKLQMQITVDGFVAGPEGQLDWMTWDMDEKLIAFINHLTDTSDTILLGRKMTEGFIKYWEGVVANPSSPSRTG
jgi:hypothetical protein